MEPKSHPDACRVDPASAARAPRHPGTPRATATGMPRIAGLGTLLLLLGVAACSPDAEPATDQEAQQPQMTVQQAPECYLARGTMEEAADRPSPLMSESVNLEGAEVRVCYGAPSARDRQVMGELVPFGEPWRAGANEATTINVAAPTDVAGIRLEPGSYSLYTIPGEDSWTIVLNDNAERWGIPINDDVRSADIGTATVTPEATEGMVEQLTFRFDETGSDSAHLVMEWENTRIRIPVERLEG